MLHKAGITDKFIANIEIVYNKCDIIDFFGQADVQNWLECSKSKATNVMNAMRKSEIIEKIKGFGPGKYKFISIIK